MPKDIQERMRALIVQHGSALATLAALRQQPEAQQKDEQTDSLKNPIPRINAAQYMRNVMHYMRIGSTGACFQV